MCSSHYLFILLRLRRVQEARDNGQLLVFSPTHRDSQELNDSSIDNSISGKDFEVSSEASVNQSSLTESHHLPPPSNGTDPDLFKEMMQKIDAKLSTVGAADKELFGFKINVLNEKIVQVETEKTALEGKLKEVTSKLVEEKESYLVDRTRLESQIESTSREADIKVSMLKDARDKIQSQFEALQSEKMELLGRVKELEARIITTQAQLDDSKNHLAALQDDNRAEVAGLESKWKEMKTLNEDLSRKAEALELEQRESQSKISDYESCIRSLEQNLQDSMRELSKYKEMVASKSSAESQLVSQVDKLRQKVQKLENKVSELSSVNEEQRSSFQQLNEQSGVELEKLQKDKAEKDAKIGELFKQVGELEQIVEKEREKASSGIESIENCLQEKEKHIDDLNRSLQNALNQVKSVNASRADLEVQVQKELDDMKAQVEQYEQYLQQEKKQKVEALDKVSLLERRLNENESDMQKRIRTIEKERDEALVSMQCFNDREHELYRRLQESDRIRKSLHSRVMQLMGNIRVFVRVRPPLPDEIDAEKARLEKEASDGKKRKRVDDYTLFRFPGVYDQQCKRPASNSSSDDASKNIIELTEPYKDRGGLSERQKKYRYAFDGVFSPDHGQEDIWEATEPLIQCAIDGFNVTLFAYGQTGAGKTYTMLGGQGQEEGIIGRSVKMLFSKKDEIESLSKGGTSVKISVELLEIYNEQVRDLLAPNSGPQGREVPLKVTSKEVVGNVKVDTSTQEEVMKILHLAQKRRCVKATSSNSESSRSHMLFTIHYMSTSKDGIATEGKLNICDLAGSERLSKSGAHNVGVGACHFLNSFVHFNRSISLTLLHRVTS